jgi:hypothetical protein
MDLAQEAATRLHLDPDTAATALGSLLMGVRMGLDPHSWQQIRDAMPELATLANRAPPASGRTAEMFSLTAPGAVRKSLEASGLSRSVVDGLADTLRNALRSHLSPDPAGRAIAALDRAVT